MYFILAAALVFSAAAAHEYVQKNYITAVATFSASAVVPAAAAAKQ